MEMSEGNGALLNHYSLSFHRLSRHRTTEASFVPDVAFVILLWSQAGFFYLDSCFGGSI